MSETNVKDLEDSNKLEKTGKQETMSSEDRSKAGYIYKRWSAMNTQRGKESWKRDDMDLQVNSEVPNTNDGRANVNMPIEQNMIELYLGLKTAILSYKVTADGEIDGGMLEIQRHLLDHFVKKEGIIKELKKFYYGKAKYGTGFLWSGVSLETKLIPEGDDYFNNSGKGKAEDIYHIGIKDLPIRTVRFDEKALSSKEAMDCIYEEDMAIEEFKLRYGNKKNFKYVDSVGTDNDFKSSPGNEITTTRNVKVWHYFNKLSGTYAILVNKSRLIWNGRMTTKHGELPIVSVQHYINTLSLHGKGVCDKLASIKPYVNQLLKVGLDNAWVNSGRIFAIDNNAEVDGEYYVEPGQINMWRFTGDLRQSIQEYPNSAPIIQWLQAILSVIEDYGIQNTGYNLKAPYSSPAGTAFEAGLMQEQQNARVKTVDEDANIGIGEALTMMLSNILQFAPSALSGRMYNETGSAGDLKTKGPYKVKIQGKKITKQDDGSRNVEDDQAAESYFELSKENLDGILTYGLKATIETPTTQSMLPSLEKAEFSDALNQAMALKYLFPELNVGDGQGRWDRYQKTRGFNMEQYSIKTKQQQMREKQAAILDTINNFDQQPVDEMAQATAEQQAANPAPPQPTPPFIPTNSNVPQPVITPTGGTDQTAPAGVQ